MDHPLLIQSYFQEEIEVPRGNFGCLPVESNWLLEASPHIGLRQNYNQTTVFLASPRPCWRNADKRISLAAIVFVACFHPTLHGHHILNLSYKSQGIVLKSPILRDSNLMHMD